MLLLILAVLISIMFYTKCKEKAQQTLVINSIVVYKELKRPTPINHFLNLNLSSQHLVSAERKGVCALM